MFFTSLICTNMKLYNKLPNCYLKLLINNVHTSSIYIVSIVQITYLIDMLEKICSLYMSADVLHVFIQMTPKSNLLSSKTIFLNQD